MSDKKLNSKKSEGVEVLKDKVVSDGTLKPQDLIPKFLDALKYDEKAHSKFLKDFPEILEIQSWDELDEETQSMLVDELIDALNGIAPEGYFFGASEGDGASFGFWSVGPDESKKPEAKKCEASDTIKMNIDYNTFMRLCDSAAYLSGDKDYHDALWNYYFDGGEITVRADEFFDNLFQYTDWKDAEEIYDEVLDDEYKDDSKSKEECIQAAIDAGDLDAYRQDNGMYLIMY